MTFQLTTHRPGFTNHGPIDILDSSSTPITVEYAHRKYRKYESQFLYENPYFCMKNNSPHFNTLWKGWINKDGELLAHKNGTTTLASPETSLETKVNNLTVGVVGLGVVTAVGLGATAVKFIGQDQRLNRSETILQAYTLLHPIPFSCGYCSQPIQNLFGNYCGYCGMSWLWPDERNRSPKSDQQCPRCQAPVKAGQIFCTMCRNILVSFVPEPTRLQWRLP